MASVHHVIAKGLAALATSHHPVTLPLGVIWSPLQNQELLLMGVNF